MAVGSPLRAAGAATRRDALASAMEEEEREVEEVEVEATPLSSAEATTMSMTLLPLSVLLRRCAKGRGFDRSEITSR